jgi:hypothetical protein
MTSLPRQRPPRSSHRGRTRLSGARHHSDRGPWYTVEFSRVYKEDDGWHESDSLTVEDVPAQLVLNQLATKWILDQEADAAGRKRADSVTAK